MDLPIECFALIFSLTTPKDVKRLGAVNKLFLQISKLDEVWHRFLPPHWQEFVGEPESTVSLCDIYNLLCSGVYDCHDKQLYMVEKGTGGLIRMLSARAITIIWGDDPTYWKWISGTSGSMFSEVVYLRLVWWLEVKGQIRGFWPRGKYSVWFKLKLSDIAYGWKRSWHRMNPVIFGLQVGEGDGVGQECYSYLEEARNDMDTDNDDVEVEEEDDVDGAIVRDAGDGWKEYCAGEFSVEDANAPIELRFYMTEIKNGMQKGGLYVDGVIIRPVMALASSLLRRRSISFLSRSSNLLRNGDRGFASGSSAAKMQENGDGFDAASLDTVTDAVSNYNLDTSSLWPIFRAPVTAVSTFLDSVHSSTGAPWWVVLVGSTLAMRAALFPFTVLQIQKTTKFAQVAWKLPPPIPLPGTGVSYTDQFKLFVRRRKELGVPSLAWFFASFAVQIPIFITWIVAIRHMAINKFPGFDSGGTLWFTDLTVPIDGNLGVLFPASVAVTYICNIETSLKGLQPKPGLVGSLVTFYCWWLRLCVVPIYISGFYFPQGVFMYWLPNSLCSLAQTLALRNGNVRRALGLPSLPSTTKAAVDTTNVKVYSTAADATSNVEVCVDEDTDSDTLIKLAAEHVAQNKPDAAMKCLQIVIQKDPENATAYFALGKIHADANQWSEGASFLATAASMAKQEKLQIQSYLALGIALHNQGNLSEAITALKCIANMEVPQDPECRRKYYMALVTLGSMLSKDGQKAEALEYLGRAAEYDPRVGELYVTKIKEELVQTNEAPAEEIVQVK